MSKIRERFEAAVPGDHRRWSKDTDEYLNNSMQDAWRAYQAALEPVRELYKRAGRSVIGYKVLMDELAKLLEE